MFVSGSAFTEQAGRDALRQAEDQCAAWYSEDGQTKDFGLCVETHTGWYTAGKSPTGLIQRFGWAILVCPFGEYGGNWVREGALVLSPPPRDCGAPSFRPRRRKRSDPDQTPTDPRYYRFYAFAPYEGSVAYRLGPPFQPEWPFPTPYGPRRFATRVSEIIDVDIRRCDFDTWITPMIRDVFAGKENDAPT